MAFLDNTGLTKLIQLIKGSLPTKATSSTLGLVKPDNSTITVDSDGTVAWGLSDRIMAGSSGNKTLVLCSDKKINASADEALSIAKGVASGIASIAHGLTTEASGQYSVATGKSKALANYSHAENKGVAKGFCSHAEGLAIASSACQHAEGKYNIEDTNGIFQHIVGAGTYASSPSTISAGDWNGNKYLAGNLYVGCNDFTTTANGLTTANAGGSKVATETFVNTAISNLSLFSGSYNDLTNKPSITSGTGTNSIQLGEGTVASSANQIAEGKYNVEDANGMFQCIAGGGSSSTRSTLYGRDWSGNVYVKTDLYVKCSDFTTSPTGGGVNGNKPSFTTAYCGGQKVFYGSLVSTETNPTVNGAINWVYG